MADRLVKLVRVRVWDSTSTICDEFVKDEVASSSLDVDF